MNKNFLRFYFVAVVILLVDIMLAGVCVLVLRCKKNSMQWQVINTDLLFIARQKCNALSTPNTCEMEKRRKKGRMRASERERALKPVCSVHQRLLQINSERSYRRVSICVLFIVQRAQIISKG